MTMGGPGEIKGLAQLCNRLGALAEDQNRNHLEEAAASPALSLADELEQLADGDETPESVSREQSGGKVETADLAPDDQAQPSLDEEMLKLDLASQESGGKVETADLAPEDQAQPSLDEEMLKLDLASQESETRGQSQVQEAGARLSARGKKKTASIHDPKEMNSLSAVHPAPEIEDMPVSLPVSDFWQPAPEIEDMQFSLPASDFRQPAPNNTRAAGSQSVDAPVAGGARESGAGPPW